VISHSFFNFFSSEDQVVSITRQKVDERQPSKSFVKILLLVFFVFLNLSIQTNVTMF
jgi:hypothetical protein